MAKNLVNGTNVVIEENGDNINMNLSSAYTTNLQQEINDSFKENNIYSTTETVVGTWLGKPIYRKVFTGTLPTGSGENTFNFSGINIINFYGEIKATSGATFLINTYYTPLPAYSISSWIDNSGNLKIECGSNYNTSSKYFIIVEYTKTTD